MSTRLLRLLVPAVVLGILVSGCAQPAAPTPAPTAAAKPPAAQPTPAPAIPTPAATGTSAAAAKPAAAEAKPAAQAPAVKPLSPVVTVKVALMGNTADAGVFIARERGYFKEEGLDLQTSLIATGADTIAPLATGELHFGSGSGNPGLFNAVARGLDVKIVAGKTQAEPGRDGAGLLVRKDLYDSGQVKELSQLKGKTIAVNQKATTAEMYVEKDLEKGGVKITEVNLVEMPFPDMIAALANKAIDAAWEVEPMVSAITKRGIGVQLYSMADTYPNHYTNMMLGSPVFAKEQPEAAKRFITAHLRGQRDFYNAYVKKTAPMEPIIEILTKNTTVKDPQVLKGLRMGSVDPNGYIHAEFLPNDQEYFFQRGWVKQKIDTTKLVDFQYVEHALQRLGKIN